MDVSGKPLEGTARPPSGLNSSRTSDTDRGDFDRELRSARREQANKGLLLSAEKSSRVQQGQNDFKNFSSQRAFGFSELGVLGRSGGANYGTSPQISDSPATDIPKRATVLPDGFSLAPGDESSVSVYNKYIDLRAPSVGHQKAPNLAVASLVSARQAPVGVLSVSSSSNKPPATHVEPKTDASTRTRVKITRGLLSRISQMIGARDRGLQVTLQVEQGRVNVLITGAPKGAIELSKIDSAVRQSLAKSGREIGRIQIDQFRIFSNDKDGEA